jgi:prolyl oligopeptidase
LLRFFAIAASVVLLSASLARAADPDPFLWLEDVNGARATAWVAAENAKTLGVLQSDPRYAGLYADALKIAEAKDRIPAPELIGDQVYNFWRDETHVRGIWRRTSKADYASADPHWTTALDLDALAASEHANWVWKGADCPPPAFKRCLILLSDGGEDAVTIREFDLGDDAFVPGGFDLPHSKQSADWLDDDTLILARDWGPGTMTASGYPFVVKTLKRGQSLDQAREVFRGQAADVSVDPDVLHDAQGHKLVLVQRSLDAFHAELWQQIGNGFFFLPLPEQFTLHGLLDGRLVFTTEEDWTCGTCAVHSAYSAGSLVAYPLAELRGAATPAAEHLIFRPGPRQSVEEAAATATRVEAVINDDVKGSLYTFQEGAAGWTSQALPTAPNSSVGVATASEIDDSLYYDVTNFLTPTSLFQADAANGASALVKTTPPRFDASGDTVDQFEATSSDGTKIPYFVVHPKAMKLDGSNPTILYAYGGFQISETPFYSGVMGKLWLERGGVFVLANIRGGGEFGPAWHEAALKTHRQVAYDDFAAVAKDLIARGITSPRRLGIEGGSNGGLLMGVEFVQHPELWRAVDMQVPLLDMLRYEQIAAGASWVGEYGSVANPDERAFLASISPYANLKAGVRYPEPLIWTTTKDDRVGPQHARKFAAALAALGDPYLFYEVTEGGHGSGANLKESAQTSALEMAYFIERLMD